MKTFGRVLALRAYFLGAAGVPPSKSNASSLRSALPGDEILLLPFAETMEPGLGDVEELLPDVEVAFPQFVNGTAGSGTTGCTGLEGLAANF